MARKINLGNTPRPKAPDPDDKYLIRARPEDAPPIAGQDLPPPPADLVVVTDRPMSEAEARRAKNAALERDRLLGAQARLGRLDEPHATTSGPTDAAYLAREQARLEEAEEILHETELRRKELPSG